MGINIHVKFNNLYESILSGLAKGKSIEDIAKLHGVDVSDIETQVKMGAPKEKKEHGCSLEQAEEIAKDHLVEDPKYYTKLAQIEKD